VPPGPASRPVPPMLPPPEGRDRKGAGGGGARRDDSRWGGLVLMPTDGEVGPLQLKGRRGRGKSGGRVQ
jgi:hypothetical protein